MSLPALLRCKTIQNRRLSAGADCSKKDTMILSPSSVALLRSSACATSLALAVVLSPAAFAQDGEPVAQEAPEDASEGGEIVNEIVVSGARLRGQLDTDVPPLLELNEEDIAAEGVTSIADLITQISNQTGSARGRGGGRPVILINGIRVGSFSPRILDLYEAVDKRAPIGGQRWVIEHIGMFKPDEPSWSGCAAETRPPFSPTTSPLEH